MHLDSQRPVSGKTWPVWKPGCTGTSMSEHQCCTSALWYTGIWAGFIPPTCVWLWKSACSQASVSRGYTHVVIFLWKGKKNDVTIQEHMAQGPMRPSWLASAEDLHGLCKPCDIARTFCTWAVKDLNPKGAMKGSPYLLLMPAAWLWVHCWWESREAKLSLGKLCQVFNFSMNDLSHFCFFFNPPGTQGFPRESVFASQWKGKWPLQAAKNITQPLIPHLSK